MAENDPGLVVRVGANIQGLQEGLRQGGQQVRRFSNDTSREVQGLGASFTQLRSAVLGPIGAVVGSMAGLIGTINSAREAMDKTAKSAAQFNILPQTFDSIAITAGYAGVNVTDLEGALRKMQNVIGSALVKGGSLEEILGRLGTSAAELSELSGDEQLAKLAEGLSTVTNEAEKAYLAAQLFGKTAGTKMLLFLNNGAEGVNDATKAFEKMGVSISEIDYANVETLNDTIDELGVLLASTGKELTASLAPGITAAIQSINDAAIEFNGLTAALGEVAENSGIALPNYTDLISQVIKSIPQLNTARAAWLGITAAVGDWADEVNAGDVNAAAAAEQAALEETTRLAYEKTEAYQNMLKLQRALAAVDAGFMTGGDDPFASGAGTEGAGARRDLLENEPFGFGNGIGGEGTGSDAFGTSGGAEGGNAFEEGGEADEVRKFFMDPLDQFDLDSDPFRDRLDEIKEMMSEIREEAEWFAGSTGELIGDHLGRGAETGIGAMRMLAEGFAGQSRKMFELAKAWAYADAVVSTSKGVMAALGQQNYGAAAFIAAKGAVEIARINSMKFGGKSGSSSSGGSAGPTQQSASGPASEQQPIGAIYVEGFDPRGLYTGAQVEGIYNALAEYQKDNGGRGRLVFGNSGR